MDFTLTLFFGWTSSTRKFWGNYSRSPAVLDAYEDPFSLMLNRLLDLSVTRSAPDGKALGIGVDATPRKIPFERKFESAVMRS